MIALEQALTQARSSDVSVNTLIASLKERLESIENPHKALEQELAQLVANKTPPNGEIYSERLDKRELCVPFFHRVYGRFYKAGILYRFQLGKMDPNLTQILAQYKGAINLPTKRDANDKALVNVDKNEVLRLAMLVTRRRNGHK